MAKTDMPGKTCLLGCDAVPFGPETSTNRCENPKVRTDLPFFEVILTVHRRYMWK